MTPASEPEPVRAERVSDAALKGLLGLDYQAHDFLAFWDGGSLASVPLADVVHDLRDARDALKARDERAKQLEDALRGLDAAALNLSVAYSRTHVHESKVAPWADLNNAMVRARALLRPLDGAE